MGQKLLSNLEILDGFVMNHGLNLVVVCFFLSRACSLKSIRYQSRISQQPSDLVSWQVLDELTIYHVIAEELLDH